MTTSNERREEIARLAERDAEVTDEAAGCTCTPYWQDAGGGYTEYVPEYEPSCPEHSQHVWNPRTGEWVFAGVTDEMVEAGAQAMLDCWAIDGDPPSLHEQARAVLEAVYGKAEQ